MPTSSDRQKNANILVLDVLAGVVQDKTPGHTYERVIYMLIAIKAIDIFVGPIYDYLDGRWLGHSLRMPEKARVAFRTEAIEQKKDLRGWRVEKKVFWSVAGIMTAWVVVGWVVSVSQLACVSVLAQSTDGLALHCLLDWHIRRITCKTVSQDNMPGFRHKACRATTAF